MTDRKLTENKKLPADKTDPVLDRVDTAQSTRSGIRFKWMNFHDRDVTPALLDDLLKDAAVHDKPHAPARVQVIIKDPADAGAILVWNRGGQPQPHFVTLRNRDSRFEHLRSWHREMLRKCAKPRDLDFQSEADLWEVRDRLRKHWEQLAGKLPMRESIDARRGLAFSQGAFDDPNLDKPADDDIEAIIESEFAPSTDGLNQPEGVPDAPPVSSTVKE
jgi:putative transposase